MDLTRPVTYRGLTLTGAEGGPGGDNPIDGIRLTRVAMTDVPPVGYTEKRALGEGLDASDVYSAGRNITLTGEVFGETKAKFFDSLDRLRDVFSAASAYREDPTAQGYLPLIFSQATEKTTHWPSGFIDKLINVRPVAAGDYDLSFGPLGGSDTRGFVVPFAVALQAKDPQFESTTGHLETLTGSGGVVTAENKGNTPAPLVLTYPTPGGAFLFNLHSVPYFDIALNLPSTAGAVTITVDCKNKVIYANPGTLRMDIITFDIDGWPHVPPTGEGAFINITWSCTSALGSPGSLAWDDLWA